MLQVGHGMLNCGGNSPGNSTLIQALHHLNLNRTFYKKTSAKKKSISKKVQTDSKKKQNQTTKTWTPSHFVCAASPADLRCLGPCQALELSLGSLWRAGGSGTRGNKHWIKVVANETNLKNKNQHKQKTHNKERSKKKGQNMSEPSCKINNST